MSTISKAAESVISKISIKKENVARTETTRDAYKLCIKKSSIARYFPRYFETDTHYIFFFWDHR